MELAKARVELRAGNFQAVERWAENRDEAATAENQPLHLAEQLLLARFYLAKRHTAAAVTLLQEEREAATQSQRAGDLVAILALLALARAAQGAEERAQVILEEALRLGEPANYVRLFVDLGPPMARLLREAAVEGIALDYVTRLLAAFAESEQSSQAAGLVEPLSERELEVLRLIAAGLTNREIAEQLVIAYGTAKRHASNIYGKLAVDNRTQAVARARELRLL
jgi:LuxR family maltose regulon positive regulatory protein